MLTLKKIEDPDAIEDLGIADLTGRTLVVDDDGIDHPITISFHTDAETSTFKREALKLLVALELASRGSADIYELVKEN